MKEQLENFLNSQGIKKKTTEFNLSQETLIQPVIEKVLKPALEKLSDELNSYSNMKADLIVSKKSSDSTIENIELKVYKIMQPKFFYRLRFLVEKEEVFVIGQFCEANLYGEATTYNNSKLKKAIANVNEEDITSDFLTVFEKSGNLK